MTTSRILIRSLARDDLAAWKPLWDGYNAFYGREGSTALPAAITQVTWQRFFDACEPVHALVAELNGRLVGLAHYVMHRSTTRMEPTCYLQDLFTLASARGQGVGRRLIEGVYEQAALSGGLRVYWQTHVTNTAARALYNQVASHEGFIIYAKLV